MLAIPMTDAQTPILLTRPEAGSARFKEMLRRAGVDAPIVVSPVLRIVPCSFDMPERFGGAIFTSKQAVNLVRARAGQRCWCVGDSTAEAALAEGWQAVSAGGDAEALYRRIMADVPDGLLVHFRGEHARGDLADRLTKAGIETCERVVYRQESVALNAPAKALLERENPLILPLFSPRSAEQIVQAGPFQARLTVVAISNAVAAAAEGLGPKSCIVAQNPDAEAMATVVKALQTQQTPL